MDEFDLNIVIENMISLESDKNFVQNIEVFLIKIMKFINKKVAIKLKIYYLIN